MRRRELVAIGLSVYWAGALGWILQGHPKPSPSEVVIYVAPGESWKGVAASLQKVHLLNDPAAFLAKVQGMPRQGPTLVRGRPGGAALQRLFSKAP